MAYLLDTSVPSLYLASNVVIVKTPNSSLPDAVFVSMALLSTKKPGCFGRGDGSSALFQDVTYRSAAVPKLSSNLMPGNLVSHGTVSGIVLYHIPKYLFLELPGEKKPSSNFWPKETSVCPSVSDWFEASVYAAMEKFKKVEETIKAEKKMKSGRHSIYIFQNRIEKLATYTAAKFAAAGWSTWDREFDICMKNLLDNKNRRPSTPRANADAWAGGLAKLVLSEVECILVSFTSFIAEHVRIKSLKASGLTFQTRQLNELAVS
ncbi:hypothetical protein RJ640_004565 [Escallonia rubra]|uniref:Uncharacterized protein n=1 Tax=Escallonia rubra TaxID=112253 RepID=A0AA88RL93_9ASTE|nr:hypothetical protein RJ640_004565 [Escallonia rubra]